MCIVIVCFALIIRKVYVTDKSLKSITTTHQGRRIVRNSQTAARNKVEESYKNTKIVLFQTAAYFVAFLLTLFFPFLRAVLNSDGKVVSRLKIIFLPLQGFFNSLIFVSHKIYNYRRVHQEISMIEALKLLFQGYLDEPLLFSRISRIEIENWLVNIELADDEGAEKVGFDLVNADILNVDMDDDRAAFAGKDNGECSESHNLSGFSCFVQESLGNKDPSRDSHTRSLSGFSTRNNMR